MGKKLRLDKYLADVLNRTRSEVKSLIRKKRVVLNGQLCTSPDIKVDIEEDEVIFDGNKLEYHEYIYLMLHKPAGVISSTEDRYSRTVLDLIDEAQKKDLFPVGRLDKDAEGLLLLTNDGELAHRLLSPSKHVDKVYYVRVKGSVCDGDREAFKSGVPIGDGYITLPAVLNILKQGDISETELTIQEGKFHQVKRMFKAVGKEVIYLKRIFLGGLALDPSLLPGQYRRLTEEEVEYLKNL